MFDVKKYLEQRIKNAEHDIFGWNRCVIFGIKYLWWSSNNHWVEIQNDGFPTKVSEGAD